MVTKELLDFIKNERQKGLTDDVIRQQLLKTNWTSEDVNAAFQSLDTGTPIPTTPPSPQMDPRTIIVVLALVLFYPVGVILMWWWMKTWPLWIKILISLVLLALFIIFLLPIFLVFFLPKNSLHKTSMQENNSIVSPTLPAAKNSVGNSGTVCSGDNGCKFRSPGSGYRCDAKGVFGVASESSHFCTCDSQCNVHIQ